MDARRATKSLEELLADAVDALERADCALLDGRRRLAIADAGADPVMGRVREVVSARSGREAESPAGKGPVIPA